MSPCGRIVDILRSCYSAPMRFFTDSALERTVDWYFVPDSREMVPMPTAFGSRIYDRETEEESPIGERFEPHPWRGGDAPCPAAGNGTCGDASAWENGVSISTPTACYPGTTIPLCCKEPLVGQCGGVAIGGPQVKECVMDVTFDVFRPFGAASPLSTNNAGQFTSDLLNGRGSFPTNTVAWTDFLEMSLAVDVVDGCTRIASLNTLTYADGDEIRIPSAGPTRYVVVWATPCDSGGTTIRRAYLMRHAV